MDNQVKSINEYVVEAHQNAVEHGWWEKEPLFGELIALIHSEASEALEEARKGREPGDIHFECLCTSTKFQCPYPLQDCTTLTTLCPFKKPEGIPSELADIVIRVMDLCGHYGIDLQAAIDEKMAYNRTRPYKHGKTF